MVHQDQELPQAWWFDSHSLARTSPWLNTTLSELDGKTKQMLKLIDQDADSFAQRAEMYYKKRPVLVDMLGDLYRAHRSLAEQHDLLLKHGGGARHTAFGLSSCAHTSSRPSHSQAPSSANGKTTPPRSSSSSCSASAASSMYDSESEVDDPEQEDDDDDEAAPAEQQQQQQLGITAKTERQQHQQEEEMRAEIERLRAQNAALEKAAEERAAALRAELAGKDEEKREVIRQLASSMDVMRQENLTLREHIAIARGSSSSSSSKHSSARSGPRAAAFEFDFDLRKVARGLFSARLFTARCRPTGPIVAL